MRKRFYTIGLILFIVLASIAYWLYQENQYKQFLQMPVSSSTERIPVKVNKGDTATSVATQLYEKKLVVNDGALIRYLKEKKYDSSIKSGTYVLQPNETIPEIAEILVGNKKVESTLTIPEGYTIKQIDALLKDNSLVQKNEFLDCVEKCSFAYDFLQNKAITGLEGFLFPSTYYIDSSSFSPESFINRLLGTFEKQIAPYKKDIATDKLYDTVIMASLIERETKTDEERPIVAGILWKRLKNNWYLGVDATLRYYNNDWVSELTYADLADKNPYNTRTHLGLPPTPIANPGLSSLKAAIYPKETEYWYYLHDKAGQIHYARTLEEHTQNKLKYLN